MNRGLYGFPSRRVYREYDPSLPPLVPSSLDDEFDIDFPTAVGAAPPQWNNVGVLSPTSTIRNSSLVLTCTGTVSNNSVGIERGNLPAGPFTLFTRIQNLVAGRFNVCGVYVRSTASGRFVSIGQYLRSNGGYYDLSTVWERYNNFGSRNSNGGELLLPSAENYYRLSYDGTNLTGQVSNDAVNWGTFYVESIGTWFTGGQLPDRFGVKITPFEATAGSAGFDFVRYSPVPFADLGRTIIREVVV